MKAVRGSLLYFTGDPFHQDTGECMVHETDGILVIKNGLIHDVGPAVRILPTLDPAVEITSYPDCLIMPGFIDTHTHYVQMEIIASFGHQLIDWLEEYTFVAEQKFHDKAYADRVADKFCDQLLRNGTTTAAVFCTTYPGSVDALFEQAEKRNMRMIAGKVMMDRNAPAALLDTAETSYEQSRALIEKWHDRGRASYAITPRFAPTSSAAQLEAAGTLKKEYPTVHIQSHISENRAEIDWVKKLFPHCTDYLDVYDRFGLLGDRTVLAHGIHLTASERKRLSESGAALSHCPTSNLFLGSGLFDINRLLQNNAPVKLGIGTDIGAGTSFSLLQTMGEAYKISHLSGQAMTAPQAFYLATLGGAHALNMADHVGSFKKGHEADFVVLDINATDLMAHRATHADSIEEVLFILMIMGDDRAVRATYIAGQPLWSAL
ncbi:MAG: guanine deaminase [Alphaproteobacteria bacterium]|nr:MAG: guanine deaminase [Alphaproteobacteria bacterium]